MKKKLVYLLILIFSTFNCSSRREMISKKDFEINAPELLDSMTNKWYTLDIEEDSIAGLSLLKAFSNTSSKTKPIIVALLDTGIDIHHKDLKNNIWRNLKEIPNNNKDDDNNGYKDDICGWNFLGNPKGENIIETNKEYVRIYRYYDNLFRDVDSSSLTPNKYLEYQKYTTFKKKYLKAEKALATHFKNSDYYYSKYVKAKKALKQYFPKYKYSIEQLNKIDTIGNGLGEHVKMIELLLRYKDTDENFTKNYIITKAKFEKRGNVKFNERDILNEDENNISDTNYGNNKVANNLNIFKHATEVANIIKEDFIKIMPLAVVTNGGDPHDKDIALAIRYAVDNGARIINMSFGKDYSLHPNWVFDAIKYAEKHNVLIVSSAGNSGTNLDEITTYPNDHNGNGIEVSDNFLMVGGSTREPNENLYYINSNYGKTTVDIFAPAVDIYTTIPNNEYITDTGTSLAAALTSKVAALIFSNYPNLNVSQVKHIIMDSGVEYTFPVKTPTRKDKDKMTPFNELSKSGKVVNAYNALIMADSISRKQ